MVGAAWCCPESQHVFFQNSLQIRQEQLLLHPGHSAGKWTFYFTSYSTMQLNLFHMLVLDGGSSPAWLNLQSIHYQSSWSKTIESKLPNPYSSSQSKFEMRNLKSGSWLDNLLPPYPLSSSRIEQAIPVHRSSGPPKDVTLEEYSLQRKEPRACLYKELFCLLLHTLVFFRNSEKSVFSGSSKGIHLELQGNECSIVSCTCVAFLAVRPHTSSIYPPNLWRLFGYREFLRAKPNIQSMGCVRNNSWNFGTTGVLATRRV